MRTGCLELGKPVRVGQVVVVLVVWAGERWSG